MNIVLGLILLYTIPFTICILYVRYNDSDSVWDRKSILSFTWIPAVNIGPAIYVIVSIIDEFFNQDKVYNFIRKGRNGTGRI